MVIGGGVALIGPPLFDLLADRVEKQLLFRAFAGNYTLAPARLGESAVPVGALLMAARSDEQS